MKTDQRPRNSRLPEPPHRSWHIAARHILRPKQRRKMEFLSNFSILFCFAKLPSIKFMCRVQCARSLAHEGNERRLLDWSRGMAAERVHVVWKLSANQFRQLKCLPFCSFFSRAVADNGTHSRTRRRHFYVPLDSRHITFNFDIFIWVERKMWRWLGNSMRNGGVRRWVRARQSQ